MRAGAGLHERCLPTHRCRQYVVSDRTKLRSNLTDPVDLSSLPKKDAYKLDPHLSKEIHRLKDHSWWYRGRRKVFGTVLAKYVAVLPPGPVLDFGSGPGTNAELLNSLRREILTFDLSLEAQIACRQDAYGVGTVADAIATPYRNRTFSLILAADILEHVSDDRSALAEIHRILAPGGMAVIVVPGFKSLWGWQDEVSGHFRRYSPTEIRRRTEGAGLAVLRTTCMNGLLALPILVARNILRRSHFQTRSENLLTPRWADPILYLFLAVEAVLSRWIDLPYGTSVVCVARRPE